MVCFHKSTSMSTRLCAYKQLRHGTTAKKRFQ